MSKRFMLLGGLALCACFFGCSRQTIDNVPVDDIEPSQPPAFEKPAVKEPVFGVDGVYKISDKKYFGAVVPIGAVEIGCDTEQCSFYVPNMMATEIKYFLEKYFPYQKMERFARVNSFEVYPEIKSEYGDGSIVPDADINVVHPTAETAVYIQVYWSRSESRFNWKYQNPMVRQRVLEDADKFWGKPEPLDEFEPPFRMYMDDPGWIAKYESVYGQEIADVKAGKLILNADNYPEYPDGTPYRRKAVQNNENVLFDGVGAEADGVMPPDMAAPDAGSDPSAEPGGVRKGISEEEFKKMMQEKKNNAAQ